MGVKVELNPFIVRDNEQEILAWCKENNIIVDHVYLPGFCSIFEKDFYTYYFACAEDAAAFKLRWL
jgi:hypothetical protein